MEKRRPILARLAEWFMKEFSLPPVDKPLERISLTLLSHRRNMLGSARGPPFSCV
jgi:hypothetical protein